MKDSTKNGAKLLVYSSHMYSRTKNTSVRRIIEIEIKTKLMPDAKQCKLDF